MTDTQEHLDGLAPGGTHVSFLGATVDVDDAFELGETVTFTIKGHVVLEGREARETAGVRRIVKVRCDLIEVG